VEKKKSHEEEKRWEANPVDPDGNSQKPAGIEGWRRGRQMKKSKRPLGGGSFLHQPKVCVHGCPRKEVENTSKEEGNHG